MKILIGCPVYRTISVKTAFSLIDMIKNTPYETEVIFQEGIFIHQNQNNIVDYAVEKGFDYVFFVEHDMVFEPDILKKLLKDNKDIICANYNHRSEPQCSMVYGLNDKGELIGFNNKEIPTETFKCGAIPTGLTLIKTSIFEKLKKPYFFYKYNDEGIMESSQDVYFCQKAREAGFDIWCNPNIQVGHLGEYLF